MTDQTEIENWVINQFTELTDYGFSEPVIKREDGSSVFDWLGSDIALELEFDWRELDVFLLVVRLEDGQLPQGYYVSNGKPCRFHLQKVIKEKRWSVALAEMKVISVKGNHKRSQNSSVDNLKKRVLTYKVVLMSCIDQLLDDSQTIFNV